MNSNVLYPVDWRVIRDADIWLDDAVGPAYQAQRLAQDWARVSKVSEEIGEAIAELILATGQNPRKARSIHEQQAARERMLNELADVVMTATLAIQHFTKDVAITQQVIDRSCQKLASRIPRG